MLRDGLYKYIVVFFMVIDFFKVYRVLRYEYRFYLRNRKG